MQIIISKHTGAAFMLKGLGTGLFQIENEVGRKDCITMLELFTDFFKTGLVI